MSDQSDDQTEAELEKTRKVVAESMAAQAAAADEVVPVPEAEPEAPRGNATRDEWAAFAASQGVAVTDDQGRDEIRDLFT
jgi:hypothetical protein